MKKENFVTLIMSVVGGLIFASECACALNGRSLLQA